MAPAPDGPGARAGVPSFAPDRATTVSGALDERDGVDEQGRRNDRYELTLAEGERVRIDLSASYDTLLRVAQPEGETLENDDAEEGTLDSRLQFVAAHAGRYTVVCTSFSNDARGEYRLRVARGAGIPRPDPPRGPVLVAGVSTQGALGPGDATERGGRFVDEYKLEGRRGDLLRLDVQSRAFDTYVTVVTPDGERWISDDITGAETDSRVQATLPVDGAYAVRVSSFGAGSVGAYTVRYEQSSAPQRTALAPGAPVTQVAGRFGRGSVYGIFIGIRDYGGEAANLPFCDDDARELARVLRDRGVQSTSQQIVLTNAEATPAALRGAFATMAQRVGPDDVLLFFYSGHGSQVRAPVSATEPDGLDETIRLRGGSLRDDELAALVAPVRGTALVALDSCYSGGFARDLVSAPDRVGIFSSEEDVLSNVAAQWRAGGYLSFWLRNALAGQADEDRDRSLRWGEVTDYVYGQFAAQRRLTGTTGNGGGRTFQHVIVARGSVVRADLLFRYPE